MSTFFVFSKLQKWASSRHPRLLRFAACTRLVRQGDGGQARSMRALLAWVRRFSACRGHLLQSECLRPQAWRSWTEQVLVARAAVHSQAFPRVPLEEILERLKLVRTPKSATCSCECCECCEFSCGFRTRSKRLPFLRLSGNWSRCVHLLHDICPSLPPAFPPTLASQQSIHRPTAGGDQRRGGILIPAGRYATSAPRERAPRGAAKAQLPDYSASQLWVPLPIHTLCRFAWPCIGHGNAREASWTPLPLQSLNRSWRARARAPART